MPTMTPAHFADLELVAETTPPPAWSTGPKRSTERDELLAWGLVTWDGGARWNAKATVRTRATPAFRLTTAGEIVLGLSRELNARSCVEDEERWRERAELFEAREDEERWRERAELFEARLHELHRRFAEAGMVGAADLVTAALTGDLDQAAGDQP